MSLGKSMMEWTTNEGGSKIIRAKNERMHYLIDRETIK